MKKREAKCGEDGDLNTLNYQGSDPNTPIMKIGDACSIITQK